jgi:hypothetical protein
MSDTATAPAPTPAAAAPAKPKPPTLPKIVTTKLSVPGTLPDLRGDFIQHVADAAAAEVRRNSTVARRPQLRDALVRARRLAAAEADHDSANAARRAATLREDAAGVATAEKIVGKTTATLDAARKARDEAEAAFKSADSALGPAVWSAVKAAQAAECGKLDMECRRIDERGEGASVREVLYAEAARQLMRRVHECVGGEYDSAVQRTYENLEEKATP